MNNQDKEAFEKWYSEYFKIKGITIINIPHHFTESWQAACEYMRNKSNPLDALSLYEKLETERAENKKLRDALEIVMDNTKMPLEEIE